MRKLTLTRATTLGEIELLAKLRLENVHISFVFDERDRFPDHQMIATIVVNDVKKPVDVKVVANNYNR